MAIGISYFSYRCNNKHEWAIIRQFQNTRVRIIPDFQLATQRAPLLSYKRRGITTIKRGFTTRKLKKTEHICSAVRINNTVREAKSPLKILTLQHLLSQNFSINPTKTCHPLFILPSLKIPRYHTYIIYTTLSKKRGEHVHMTHTLWNQHIFTIHTAIKN